MVYTQNYLHAQKIQLMYIQLNFQSVYLFWMSHIQISYTYLDSE